MTPSFAETLGSIGVDEFLSRFWGRSFAHLPGARGRFRSLLPWDELNAMLQRHRLEPPRLRLVRKGELAPKSSYLRYDGSVPFVVPERLAEQLRDGYTLIVDAVDDMAPRVMALAEEFERVLHDPVQVNMYAGWREQQGFHRHCDTHDVVVLQVHGRKYWRVYDGGRPHPLRDDIEPNGPAPDALHWEGMLEEGDALYIPRGVWHEASGVGDVTLHLTFGIHQRTGITLLHWLAGQLRASADFRAPLPRFASEGDRRAHLATLRAEVEKAFDDGLLDRYFAQEDGRARSRGWANLPWSVDGALPPGEAVVALDAPRGLHLNVDGDDVRFEANGRAWTFAAAAEPMLRLLAQREATVAELCDAAGLDEQTTRQFVAELVSHGLVRIR